MSVTGRYVTLDGVKRFPAVLLGLLTAALLAAGLACSGDDTQPQLGSGPADDVHGAWKGSYVASDGSQYGNFCVIFEQDNRGLKGTVKFNENAETEIGGVITESTLLFTWGAGLQTTQNPSISADISAGGTMNGTVTDKTAAGTWIAASSSGVHGSWHAEHQDSGDCE